MADSTQLVELREKFAAKQKDIGDVLELAGGEAAPDFSRKPVLEKTGASDASDALKKWQAWNKEAADLGQQCADAKLRSDISEFKSREEERKQPASAAVMKHYDENGERKSWGQLFAESKQFKQSRETRTDVPFVLNDFDLKTLFATTAGWAPEVRRSGVVVEAVTRPIQVISMIPQFDIEQPAFSYTEETTRTHASAERAEGTTFPESTFVETIKSSPVQKIADSIPVTDEQLEDVTQVRSYLEQRLGFGLRQRFDLQVLVGNGTSPNLRGINNVVGVQTRAKGADSGIVAFLKAMTDVRVTGRAVPSGAVLHPNDWLDIMLTQSAAGEFLFGNPFQGPGPTQLFGIPIAQSDAQTENTGIVADFVNFTRIDQKRGVTVQTGYVASQFVEGKITLRADMRVAFTVTRPAAVVLLTGL